MAFRPVKLLFRAPVGRQKKSDPPRRAASRVGMEITLLIDKGPRRIGWCPNVIPGIR